MATEYEWKFRANEETLSAICQGFTEPGVEFSMETTYYDTLSGDLSARHYTLRRRFENGLSVCTLKTPAGAARNEWELTCDSIEEAIKQLPGLGCPEDFAQLVKDGVTPICGARFTRIAKTVVTPECTVEIALDKGVLTGGGKELPLCEVEVELKAGDVRFCDLFAKTLAAKFGLKQETKSKFRRALDLYRGE